MAGQPARAKTPIGPVFENLHAQPRTVSARGLPDVPEPASIHYIQWHWACQISWPVVPTHAWLLSCRRSIYIHSGSLRSEQWLEEVLSRQNSAFRTPTALLPRAHKEDNRHRGNSAHLKWLHSADLPPETAEQFASYKDQAVWNCATVGDLGVQADWWLPGWVWDHPHPQVSHEWDWIVWP
jgi:hypothetical protein